MKKGKLKKFIKIFLIIFIVAICLHCTQIGLTQILLYRYIQSFEPVKYENQLVPEIGKEGYYTITTDDDIKVMQLNDLHIGAGLASLKNDKKTFYEIITMVQKEKPDLIIIAGDSVFCVPTLGFNGGGTFNNKMASKNITRLFDRLQVYYTVAFGNHDTEAFDFTNRENLGKFYASDKAKYCIFQSDFNEYGVTNQCILLKNTDGTIRKALMVLDSNDYIDDSISSSINWKYDTIHDNQVDWAADTIKSLSKSNGSDVKSLYFFHIPVGEYVTAYRDLEANGFKDTEDTKYIEGFWDEKIDEAMGERIWYGGCCQTDKDPKDVDKLFETLGPDGLNTMEGIFCGHDHVNNATVIYKGVTLAYGNSLDNIAYTGINTHGIQRGCMVIQISPDGNWTLAHKNVYKDYGASTNMFVDVDTESYLYENHAP